MTDRDPAEIEATIRRLMAAHTALAPRGWETIRQRQKIHARIDALLDELALEAMVGA